MSSHFVSDDTIFTKRSLACSADVRQLPVVHGELVMHLSSRPTIGPVLGQWTVVAAPSAASSAEGGPSPTKTSARKRLYLRIRWPLTTRPCCMHPYGDQQDLSSLFNAWDGACLSRSYNSGIYLHACVHALKQSTR